MLVNRSLDVYWIAAAWLAAAIASSLIGFIQSLGWAGHLRPWINQVEVEQVYANLRQRNQFSTLMGVGMAALLWRMSVSQDARGRGDWWLAAMLLGAASALSSSRTGFVQLHLLCLLLWIWRTPLRSRTASLFAWALAAYWAVMFAMTFAGSGAGALHRAYEDGPACASRLTLWSNVLDLIALRPFLGWGWGELDYAHYVTLYPGERFCDILDNAHNLPLHLAVELGVPVALICCIGLAVVVWRARPWHETDPARRMAWTVLLLIGVHSLLEYPLWYGPFQMAAGLSVWLLCRKPGNEGAASEARSSSACSVASLLRMAVAVLGLMACAYAAWDYHRISQIYLPPQARAEAYRSDTLAKIRDSWLFRNQVQFAELTTTELTPQNAAKLHAMALSLLHFSPEPRVIEKVIESAMLLGREDEARFHAVRYRAAFPKDYERWAARLPRGAS